MNWISVKDEFHDYLLKQRKFWEKKAEKDAILKHEEIIQQLLRIEEKYLEITNKQSKDELIGFYGLVSKEIARLRQKEELKHFWQKKDWVEIKYLDDFMFGIKSKYHKMPNKLILPEPPKSEE